MLQYLQFCFQLNIDTVKFISVALNTVTNNLILIRTVVLVKYSLDVILPFNISDKKIKKWNYLNDDETKTEYFGIQSSFFVDIT